MAHPLDDPRAKLRRADKHLAEYDAERNQWIESDPYAVLSYPNADKTEWKFFTHRFDEEIQHERDVFGLIIGDYIHNVRSALDQLVWKLVTVANGITPKTDGDVSFPIVTTHPREYWNRGMIQRQELTFEQALFLEMFQPYRAINAADKNPLAALQHLWNADKHRLVTPVRVTLADEGPEFWLTPDAGHIVTKKWDTEVPLEGDTEIAWVTIEPTGPEPNVTVSKLPIDIAFGEAQRPIDTLPIMRSLAGEIIENCARFFA